MKIDIEKEWNKCKKNPIYFITNYVKIYGLNGIVELGKEPKSLIRTFHKNSNTLAILPRQYFGKTTCQLLYALHQAVFFGKKIHIMSLKMGYSKDLYSKVRHMYEDLPLWIRSNADVLEHRIGVIKLNNGGMIKLSHTDMSTIRGYHIDILMLDEFAFVEQDIADEILATAIPTIKEKLIIATSAHTHNHIYRLYQRAKTKQIPFKIFRKTIRSSYKWKNSELTDRNEWINRLKTDLGKDRFDELFMCKFLSN